VGSLLRLRWEPQLERGKPPSSLSPHSLWQRAFRPTFSHAPHNAGCGAIAPASSLPRFGRAAPQPRSQPSSSKAPAPAQPSQFSEAVSCLNPHAQAQAKGEFSVVSLRAVP